MRTINTEYYGDDIRWFMGEIKSIQDPDKLGRVRVRIFGIHSEYNADVRLTDLPWANVVLPVTQGGTSKTTAATGIQIGARVFGIFVDGAQSQVPLVLGSVPHNPDLRVKYDGAADPFVDVSFTAGSEMFKPGDRISAETNAILEANGQATGTVGQELTPEQIVILNSVSTKQGSLVLPLVGQSRQEQTYNFLKEHFQQRGHNNPGYLAAAFVGNFMHEAGPKLDPTAVGDNGNALGLAQWNGKRKGRYFDLIQYAKSNNAGEGNFAVQLAFIAHELSDKGNEKWVWPYLRSAQTLEAATETVMGMYERPAVAGNFKSVYPLATTWRTYMNKGGIDSVSTSGQNKSIAAYRSEYLERLEDAKAIFIVYGG